MGEGPQLRRVGHQRDQPVQAELVEVRRRPAAADPAPHLDGPPRLAVAVRQVGQPVGDPADADGERAPATPAVTAYVGDHPAPRRPRRRPRRRPAAARPPRRRSRPRAPPGRPSRTPAATRRRTAPASPAAGPRDGGSAVGRRVELGDHHDDRSVEVPAEGRGVLVDVVLVVDPAAEDLAQEVALVLVLDGGDRLLAGDQQRGDRRGALQRVHVVGRDRAAAPDARPAGRGRCPRRPRAAPAPRRPRRRAQATPSAPTRSTRTRPVGSSSSAPRQRGAVVVGQRGRPAPGRRWR